MLWWALPGNLIGGGLLMGVAYRWLNGARPRDTAADDAVDAEPEAALEPERVTLPVDAAKRAAL